MRPRRFVPTLLSAFLLGVVTLFALAAQPQPRKAPDFTKLTAYPVARVIGGKNERVRLVAVDTPETVHPKKAVERFGKEASAFTKKHLNGQKVYLVYDQNNARTGHRDRYGRLLAYVWREKDRLDFCAALVKEGYAYAYLKYPSERGDEFLGYQRQAREQKKGLWGDAPPMKETKAADTVYVTARGKKYHRAGCRHLKGGGRAIPLVEARQKYQPCKVCRPPK